MIGSILNNISTKIINMEKELNIPSIELLVEASSKEKYPNGEPEPKLFSEGYRTALRDYANFRMKKGLQEVLQNIFPKN